MMLRSRAMCSWAIRCLLGVVAAVLFACGGDATTTEQPCVGDDCHCESSPQCPGEPGCFDGICYAPGDSPRNAPCVNDSDCIDGLCERDQRFCTSSCDSTNVGSCPSGWACYDNRACLELHSLPHGAQCNSSLLCPVDDTCVNRVCETVCSAGYDLAACATGSYCSVNPIPVCLESKCDPSGTDDCAWPALCIDLGESVGVCRHPCSYTFSSVYDDDCSGGIGFYELTCALLGVTEASVCIEAADPNDAGGLAGANCDGGMKLCKRGHICRGGRCRKLCWSQTSCSTGTCTQVTPDFRVCL